MNKMVVLLNPTTVLHLTREAYETGTLSAQRFRQENPTWRGNVFTPYNDPTYGRCPIGTALSEEQCAFFDTKLQDLHDITVSNLWREGYLGVIGAKYHRDGLHELQQVHDDWYAGLVTEAEFVATLERVERELLS